MDSFVEAARYVIPLIAIAIVGFCVPSLIKGNKEIGITGYLYNAANGEKIPLSGYEVSIGRSKVCDIVLNYSTVSRFHAVLSKHKEGWRITDTMSKTGTYIKTEDSKDVQRIDKPRILKDGDSIVFGNGVFVFMDNAVITPVQEVNEIGSNNYEQTNTENVNYSELFVYLIDANTNDAYRIDGLETCMIGSGDDVQIRLNDPRVSRRHAMVVCDNGIWSVTDMESQAGTKLNGRPLKRLTRLNDSDTINICDTVFIFRVYSGGGTNEE